MIMHALRAGGIPVAFHDKADQDAAGQAHDDYHPSPGGRFELRSECISPKSFPQATVYMGMAVKALPWPWTPFGENIIQDQMFSFKPDLTMNFSESCRILWLKRSAEARWAAFEKAHMEKRLGLMTDGWGDITKAWRDATAQYIYGSLKSTFTPPHFVTMWYDDIVAAPATSMDRLKKLGWPIDVADATHSITSGATKS